GLAPEGSRRKRSSPLVSLGSDCQRDVTRWRSRGKFCRSGVEERVKSRFFLAIDFTRPYSDFVFGCGKFFSRVTATPMSALQARCGRWSKAKGGRWIERLGTTPASRVVRLRLRVHQQPRSREKLSHRSGEAGASHDRRRRLPRVQPIRDQRRGRHRRVPSLHSHLARVPLCGGGRLLLRCSPPAGDRRELPGRAVRRRARLRGRDAARRLRERRRSGRQQSAGRSQLINPQSYKWFFETTTPVEGHMHAIVRTLVQAQTK